MTDTPFALTWTPRIEGATLSFEYRLENRGPDVAWALDALVVFDRDGFGVDREAAIVLEDVAPEGRVRLVRGYVQPLRSDPVVELRPTARRLAPGAAVEGRGRTPWPLRGFHPNDGEWTLRPRHPLREAVLEIGVLPGHLPLEQLPLRDGGVAQVPRYADAFQVQQLIRSAAFALPAAP